ncbi:MAG: TetR/AcrR family transcriptional regulator [Alphaproteobacteria bacterium]
MGGKKDQTRGRIIDAAYESFWRAGYTRTSVDSIAARAGVTKRTLYAHFRSKDDLLAAVLLRYNELALQRLQRIGDRMPADPDGMIDSFFGQLAGWASVSPRWSGSGFTRLVVELGDLPGHPARAIARRAKATTAAWLAERLAKARVAQPRARARDVMLLMEGSMALMLIHGDRSYIDAAARAAKHLITQKPSSNPGAYAKKRAEPDGDQRMTAAR